MWKLSDLAILKKSFRKVLDPDTEAGDVQKI